MIKIKLFVIGFVILSKTIAVEDTTETPEEQSESPPLMS